MEVAAEVVPEEAGFHGGGGGFSTGQKLVPWLSWSEWQFVRDGLFSDYPAAALSRIAAWRSRGRLLIPVDLTASFVEIRLRDPFFRNGMAGDETLESEEMLTMLYSMAIMRLVNGFVENKNKKTGYSISELSEAVGIPRVLVDIRHESSHRSLPSLRLLRLAAIKAFDWLKCIYWDSQTNAIPDAQVELVSRLHEIDQFLKGKDSQKTKSGSKRKRSEKLISKTINYVCRLYHACPSEVTSVLFDCYQLGAPESSENDDMLQTDSLHVDRSSDVQNQTSKIDIKAIITRLSEKEPRLLLGMLKSAVEMIETGEDLENKGKSYTYLPAGPSKMKSLCSLVLWLVSNIKELKDSGCFGLTHEIGVLSSDKNMVPRFCLAKLLQKFLSLSFIDERCILDAVLLLIEMAGNNNVKEKLRKLPVLSLERSAKHSALPESKINSKEQESVHKATERLEMFKLRLKERKNTSLAENCKEGLFNAGTAKCNRWSVAKSWTTCPIGKIPCSFSSTAVLPDLDAAEHEFKDDILDQHGNLEHDDHTEGSDFHCWHKKQLDDKIVPEIPRSSLECEILDMPGLAFTLKPLKGMLLIGGLWKNVTGEDLLFMKSEMKILL